MLLKNDIVSEQIQLDFSKLLDMFIAARLELLKKHNTLIPMAMVLDEFGEPKFVALKPTGEIAENMESYLNEYREMLADQYNESTAYVLGYDISLKNNNEFTDGICCELTHITGKYVRIAMPFSKNGRTGKITTGDLLRFE